MELQLTSKRIARAMAVQLITASGQITGAKPDFNAIEDIYNALVLVGGLKEKSDEDSLNTNAKIMAYSADRLLELNHMSGLSVTKENLLMIFNYISDGIIQ